MSSKIVEITCLTCKEKFMGNYQKIYCDKCAKEREKQKSKERSHRQSMVKRKKLDENFNNLNLKGLDLLPKNFNKISPIKYQNYHNHFRMVWQDILKRYNKDEELKVALLDEYKNFYQQTGWFGFELFMKYIDVSQQVMDYYDLNEFRSFIGVEYQRRTDKELRQNFLGVVYKLKRLPVSEKEFKKHSVIDVATYKRRLNIKKNFIVNLVKYYITNEEILEWYFKSKKYHDGVTKEENKKLISEKISRDKDEILETSKIAVDMYLADYGTLPVSKVFQNLTSIGTRMIKDKFNMGYREFVIYLGYDIKKYKFKKGKSTEDKVLKSIASLLNENYISQKTFDWLKGNKGWVLKCDGYFEKSNLVVEYDGEQHSRVIQFTNDEERNILNFKEVQENDKIKNELIPKHGITLLRIAFDEPYNDLDYLKIKLLEVGIVPPNYNLINNKVKNELKKIS